jgi:hypothetical protein
MKLETPKEVEALAARKGLHTRGLKRRRFREPGRTLRLNRLIWTEDGRKIWYEYGLRLYWHMEREGG